MRDPLIHIPEIIGIAFHESILRIAANFLGCVPPLYRVTVVRDFPHDRPLHSSNFHKDNDESDSLQIFIYLVDIDDTCGPLVYVPGSNHYDVRSCRPRLSRDLGLPANDGRLSDEEVERIYPRNTWAVLKTARGSIAAIHGNGIHKGPAWTRPGDPQTGRELRSSSICMDTRGRPARLPTKTQSGFADFERMTELQRLFAHATLVRRRGAVVADASLEEEVTMYLRATASRAATLLAKNPAFFVWTRRCSPRSTRRGVCRAPPAQRRIQQCGF